MTYKIQYEHLKHRGGTKEYYVFLLVDEQTNKTLFVTRWGGIGKKAYQVQAESGTQLAMGKAYDNKCFEKANKGYVHYDNNTFYGQSFDGLNVFLGRFGLTVKIDANKLAYLIGHEAFDPDVDGLVMDETAKEPPMKKFVRGVAEKQQAKLKEPEPEPANPYESDPLWGMF